MKKVIFASALLGMSLFATDFASMSTEELVNLRGTVNVEERAAFREEMMKRVQTMTAEEKQKYNIGRGLGGSPKGGGGMGMGMGPGGGKGMMLQDGSGAGMGGK